MGLCVTFVSGVHRCGKTTLLKLIRDQVVSGPVHYLRLTCRDNGSTPPLRLCDPGEKQGFASSDWVAYDRERIFEILPEALGAIRRHDRHGQVLIEADADPHLRHAFPYDHRVFVMPAPRQLDEVFRTPRQAADAFKQVLNDTTVFASEIFGLFADEGTHDLDSSSSEERPDLTDSQMRSFLNSPLGDELASRIQLQPAYHGLTESDVVVINSLPDQAGPVLRQCVERIECLLSRLGHDPQRTRLFACNLLDPTDVRRAELLDALACFLRSER
ncbi:MAG TPA: hypothetical protein VGM03_15935 [Phycisphaerae bacterium]